MGFDPISIGLMVAGTAVSAYGMIKTQQAEQQQLRARQSMTNLQAQNERLDQVRQSRIQRARIEQAGANQGVGESSSVVGGAQAVQGQAESNINYINNQNSVTNSIFTAQREEIDGRGITALGADVKGIGATLFDSDVQSGIKKTYNDVFGD